MSPFWLGPTRVPRVAPPSRRAPGWIARWAVRIFLALILIAGFRLAHPPAPAQVAVPKIVRADLYRNELAAVVAIRAIHTAQTVYYSQFQRYAQSLPELGAAGLIDAGLQSGAKDGYHFALTASRQGYTVNAAPAVFNSTGSRSFYSDQTFAIHQRYAAEPATASDPELH